MGPRVGLGTGPSPALPAGLFPSGSQGSASSFLLLQFQTKRKALTGCSDQ